MQATTTCIFQHSGAPGRDRTGDLRVTNALLCQLSHGSKSCGRQLLSYAARHLSYLFNHLIITTRKTQVKPADSLIVAVSTRRLFLRLLRMNSDSAICQLSAQLLNLHIHISLQLRKLFITEEKPFGGC